MDTIRLDLAEVKRSPPAPVIDAVRAAADTINQYPDGSYQQFRTMAGEYLGVEPDQLVLSNGLDEMIDLVTGTFSGPVVIPEPTFGQFSVAADRYDRKPLRLDALENGDYSIDPDAIDQQAGIVWLCSPNNPTGTVIPSETITAICERQEGIVVVDACYSAYADTKVIDMVHDQQNLLVLRSFSKSFALAGVRLGLAVGQRSLIEQIDQYRQPFNVNRLAVAAGKAALECISTYEKRWEAILDRGERFVQFLEQRGIETFPVNGNFVLADLGSGSQARAFVDALDDQQISVFPGWDEEFSGLPDRYVRFTIGTESQMQMVKQRISRLDQW